ncbi:dicarboxylate transporter/tellurite-resistance protein TehA [Pasteurella multocida]|uniref:dicarboxylate transporter/tellurite-resistance protein TehA n=1 Tax=Pasteurella multocida TaxID=747 RepID=UPI000F6D4A1B|nr:dicarboxylate transporter/tellurite-resistance protein TehA [Pasteurella multocida]VEJ15492.1 tellurite resistance protein TehA [Pasteurella multocida subsp. septica]HEA3247412.1 dicarboxylate transporter/tellurite-resistance protein TehA [Pasteurella multocida]
MIEQKSKPFPLPINYFGIILGLSALSLAWRYAIPLCEGATLVSESLFAVSAMIWLTFIGAYAYKWFNSHQQLKADLQHPLLGNFVSLIPITTILIGIGLVPYNMLLGIVLISLGIITQLAFAAYYIPGMWRGVHQAEMTLPAIYLPTVATNFVSATALGVLGYSELGMVFFGAGIFSWLVLEPIVLQRLRTLQPVPEPLRPMIGIQLAPAFVGCSAYLTLNGGKLDLFALMLLGYGVLQLLFLIRLLPWIFVNGFTPAMWAFSFGLASMAKVALLFYQNTSDNLLATLSLALFIFANFSIGLMLLNTGYLVLKGRFFIK